MITVPPAALTSTAPGSSLHFDSTKTTGSVLRRSSTCARLLGRPGSTCCARTTGAPKSFGNAASMVVSASMPPADDPITTSGPDVVLGVLGEEEGSSADGVGA